MVLTVEKIPSSEQHWLTESFVDPNGRVFEWRGDIYRMLAPEYAARWKELADQGMIAGLVRDGLLVESEMTNLTTESGQSVLRHRRVPVVSYCYEWLPDMLKAAALVTLELCIRLNEKGLTLQDGHPWNVLFDGTNPIYIDAGSIVPARNDILWAPYQQFCNFFLFPLYLYAAGSDRIARWLLRDYLCGVRDEDVLAALPMAFKLRHPRRTLGIAVPKLLAKLFEYLPDDMQQRFLTVSKTLNSGPGSVSLKIKFLESLRNNIDSIRFGSATSQWTRYYRTADQTYFQTDLSPGDWQQKQQAVGEILAELRPRTVLDIGANTGHYSELAVANGARVIACEVDIAALTLCYEQARRKGLNILPLAVNVFSAAPTAGRGGFACPAPLERLRSEFVMGLAVIHHAVARQRMPITRISEIFAALSSRWLLLEFAPPLRPKVGASAVPSLDDYNADDLESCLKRYFQSVVRLPSYPDERKLFRCEK